jgi:hypothetical protein
MTSKELAEAGIRPSSENIPQGTSSQVVEDVRESGVARTEKLDLERNPTGDEDLCNVEVNLNELISSKGSYLPAFVFGKSKVTTKLIKGYEEAGFFPSGDGRLPSDEETPSLEADEVVVSEISSFVDLDFPVMLFFPLLLLSSL